MWLDYMDMGYAINIFLKQLMNRVELFLISIEQIGIAAY
jgi:hypothetical protein